jgi:hypothetical protein
LLLPLLGNIDIVWKVFIRLLLWLESTNLIEQDILWKI